MCDKYPMTNPKPKDGDEPFISRDQPTGDTLVDFWRWIASDLLSNATRGMLAEFLVARALGLDMPTRAEWDSYDLETADGVKIEVKASGYVQSWYQKKPSRISFDIGKTHAWDPKTNVSDPESRRQADVYVFCLLTPKDQATINPLDLNQWQFFILSTTVLNDQLADQKTLSLPGLRKRKPIECCYNEIKTTIESLSAN